MRAHRPGRAIFCKDRDLYRTPLSPPSHDLTTYVSYIAADVVMPKAQMQLVVRVDGKQTQSSMAV